MKKLFAIAVAACALASPSVSAAATWEYYGWLPGPYDVHCVWYASTGQCSGWNYWAFNDGRVYSGGPTLTGYENQSTIRGRWTYAGQYINTYPRDFGMGGYLKAQMTNHWGVPAWVDSWAAA